MGSLPQRFKAFSRSIVRTIGFDIVRHDTTQIGNSIEEDIVKLISVGAPVVIDVGSNSGQSMLAFRRLFPNSKIHCFEPSQSTFRELAEAAKLLPNVTLNNYAVGQACEAREFFEYNHSVMNSLHKPGMQNWSEPKVAYPVKVVTIDDYCNNAGLPRIDLLKVDTQGHDLEVIQSAPNMMKAGSIRLIMCEVIFANLYEDQPSPYRFLDFLSQNGFKLVSFYNVQYLDGVLGWCDVLFVHRSALKNKPDAGIEAQ